MSKRVERHGSTRVMTAVRPGVIALRYTDAWSAFDRGPSEQLIPGIGAARCACAVKSFELVSGHVPTHFIRQVNSETIHVQEFSVPGHESLSGTVHGRVLPLEWIWRDRVYGSLLSRILNGEISLAKLGFASSAKIEKGTRLPEMLLECTTKFEPVDRHLTDTEAMVLAKIEKNRWDEARRVLTNAVETTNEAYGAVGFTCPDGKLELGMSTDGTIVLVDVFGTPDENRIIKSTTNDVCSKDLIRDWLNTQTSWKKALTRAKAEFPDDKSKWPEYPDLPKCLVDLVSDRYAIVAHRYTGSAFHN